MWVITAVNLGIGEDIFCNILNYSALWSLFHRIQLYTYSYTIYVKQHTYNLRYHSFTLFCYFIRYETRNDVWTCYWFVAMLVIHIRKQCVKVSETGIWLSSLRAVSVLFHSCSLRNLKFQTTQHFSVIKDNSPRNNPVLVSVTWVLPNTNENALDFPSLIHTTCKSLLIYLLTYWLTYLTNSITHSLHGRNSFLRS
jgi:hypothetical protein